MNPQEITLVFLGLVSYPSIVALYWVYKKPTEKSCLSIGVVWAMIMTYAGISFLALTAEARFFSALFVSYPLFLVTVFRERIRKIRLFSSRFGLFWITFLFLWLEEVFVILDYQDPGSAHLIFYIGFYAGLALVVQYFYKRWSFSLGQVFTVGGMLGMLIEQEFLLPKYFIQTLSGSGDAFMALIFAAPFIFIVYGLYLTTPLLIFYEETRKNRKATKRHVLLLYVAIVVIPLLTWGIWDGIITGLGIDLAGVI